MAITAQQVKELRDMTGAGMMDCKKALVENDGDLDAAVEYLQVKGITKAGKKSDRVAAEGLVATVASEDAKSAVIVEVNCETDFVSRNEKFHELVERIATLVANNDVEDVEGALNIDVNGRKLSEVINESIATIGENIQLRRFERYTQPEGFVASYVHAGNQIGVLVNLRGDRTDDAEEFGRDVAMHIAAMNPGYLTGDEIDAETASKQEEIFSAQVAEEGKPENIIPKIVEGKMAKWRREQALVDQPFVKNPDLTVSALQKQVGDVQIVAFVRYEVGQGIEREEANLADEVAAQLKG